MTRWLATAVLGLAGCHHDTTPTEQLTETGWFTTDTGAVTTGCPDRLVTTTPESGTQGWYWRDRPEVFTSTDDQAKYAAWLQDASGRRLDTHLTWDGLSFTVEWDGWLAANTDYQLFVQDCTSTTEVDFRTSSLGAPLEVSPHALVGHTYLLDLAGATWVEPAALAGLVQIYFTTPILLGVQYADPTSIDLLGAPGDVDPLGKVTQDPTAATWDFPVSDFSEAPWLDVEASSIALQYSDGGTTVEIPVEGFVFQGTFAPDGASIGGGVIEGLGDTRNLGPLLGDDRPEALCELAAGLGVSCVPCGDGEPYCLHIRAEDVDGTLVDGLRLVQRG